MAWNLSTYLPGCWRVARTLRDLGSGAEGAFTGTAAFTAHDDDGLLHRETGVLVWAGSPPAEASRELIWRPGGTSGSMEVFFRDGRPFHSLNLTGGTDTPGHWCAPDLYQGTFRIESPNAWTYSWRVTGPRKNLMLETRLERVIGILQ